MAKRNISLETYGKALKYFEEHKGEEQTVYMIRQATGLEFYAVKAALEHMLKQKLISKKLTKYTMR